MKNTSKLSKIWAGLLSCTMLLACDRPAAIAANAMQQYDITIRTRPESLDGYMRQYRALHQICNATREGLKLPPGPPLVEVPADFVTERTHYLASAGKFLTRHETFFIETAELNYEAGCKSRIVSLVKEDLVQDGQVQSRERGTDGKVEIYSAEQVPPPKRNAAHPFTERKNINGFALRCDPLARDLFNNKLGQEICVPDTSGSIPLDGYGDPIIVHFRAIVSEEAKQVSLTEPVSVQIGKPVSPSSLKLSIGQ